MTVRLILQLPDLPDRTALATLSSGAGVVASGHAVVMPRPDLAPAGTGQRGAAHPLFGRYRLEGRQRLRHPESAEFGWHALLFEPHEDGDSPASPSPRPALLVYGGPEGADGLMRRTQGGVRIGKPMLDLLTDRFRHEIVVELSIERLRKPAWQVWKRLPDTPALSAAPVTPASFGQDEASLVRSMQADVARMRGYTGSGLDPAGAHGGASEAGRDPDRASASEPNNDPFRWQDSDSSAPRQDEGSASAGAGASGSWDSGSSSSNESRD